MRQRIRTGLCLQVTGEDSVAHRYPGSSADKAEARDAVRDCRKVRRVIRTAFGLPV